MPVVPVAGWRGSTGAVGAVGNQAAGARFPMHRWVLQEHVWTKVLDEAWFTDIHVMALPAGDGRRPAASLLLTAKRTAT